MKDPAFLFYSKDWIEGTAEMMPEEKGVYIDLLAYQHQRGYLPSDSKRLARLVRMGVDEFEEIWKHISDKFERDGERTLNRKLEQVMNERADKGETNKIIGIFGHLCRNSEAKRSDVNKIRKEFKASKFKGIDSERLSERITEWFAERLAALEDEDANEDKDVNENKQIPTYEDFKEYALDKCSELNFNVSESQINAKYQSWKTNGWRNGNGKQIKNWKSTLLNTLPYLNGKDKPQEHDFKNFDNVQYP